jgi:hypothetical protein
MANILSLKMQIVQEDMFLIFCIFYFNLKYSHSFSLVYFNLKCSHFCSLVYYCNLNYLHSRYIVNTIYIIHVHVYYFILIY